MEYTDPVTATACTPGHRSLDTSYGDYTSRTVQYTARWPHAVTACAYSRSMSHSLIFSYWFSTEISQAETPVFFVNILAATATGVKLSQMSQTTVMHWIPRVSHVHFAGRTLWHPVTAYLRAAASAHKAEGDRPQMPNLDRLSTVS